MIKMSKQLVLIIIALSVMSCWETDRTNPADPDSNNYRLVAPENLSATRGDALTVSVSWDRVDGAEYYNVYRADDGSGNFSLLDTNITGEDESITYIDTAPVDGVVHLYRVKAFDSFGHSPDSESVKGFAGLKTPVVLPSTATYSTDQVLVINAASGSSIYFTVNNTDPATSEGGSTTEYTKSGFNASGILLGDPDSDKTYNIRAVAKKNMDGEDYTSDISATVSVTISWLPCGAATFTPNTGDFTTVVITTSTANAGISYRLWAESSMGSGTYIPGAVTYNSSTVDLTTAFGELSGVPSGAKCKIEATVTADGKKTVITMSGIYTKI